MRPKSQLQGPNPNTKAYLPVSRDLGLEAGIWAFKLRYGPGGWGDGGTKEKKEKEEKFPHMCESIGHRPLWGRCQKKQGWIYGNTVMDIRSDTACP